MNILIGYPKCSTCKKAELFLKNNNISYKYRNIKEDKLNKEELDSIIKLSNLDINKFFNTSGLVYRNLNLKEKIKDMTYDEKLDILSSDGMLVKRPIFIFENKVSLGYKELSSLIK